MGTTIYLDEVLRPAASSPKPLPTHGPDAFKVVIIWPWLGMGGAERWLIAMARHMPHVSTELGQPIVISAVVVQYLIDPATHAELSLYARVIVNRQIEQSSPAIDAAVRVADAVIIGGVPDIRRLTRNARGPVIFVAHGACSFTTQLAGAAYESGNVSHYTAVSGVSRSIFPTHMRPLVKVIENGAEVERTTSLRGREVLRRQWGVRPDQKLIGYIGRFGPDKRSEALGEAIANLPDEYVGVMIGNGDTETEALARCQGLAPGRIIWGGRFHQVGEPLAALDAWINASPAEGFCLSRIEASLAGVPVISTPTGDLPRLEHKYGRLTWPIEVGATGEEIASVIQDCFACPKITRKIAERSRRLSFRRYTAATMVARWATFIRTILGVDNDRQS